MAELPKLCRHVHLPVQSGSTRVLALMNRGYTRDDYLARIDMIRKHLPDADITTDAMVAESPKDEGGHAGHGHGGGMGGMGGMDM